MDSFSKALEYGMDTSLALVDASILGEEKNDFFGDSIAIVGDVNGDGYDDFLIGASGSDGYYNDNLSRGKSYLFFGSNSNWSCDSNISKANATFIGEAPLDMSGHSVAGAGDVNGDGFDDILIGTPEHGAGITYLIFGKQNGWNLDLNLSNVDASFVGEYENDSSGWSVAGAGDVNGDGYDDILIGAIKNREGGDGNANAAGKSYLIMGKQNGWAKETSLSDSSASFIGENAVDNSGWAVSGVGDVNGDHYDDFMIGSPGNQENQVGSGQSYLFFGKPDNWVMDTLLSGADASFIGEDRNDYSGYSLSGAGDVNGDGFDDIIIGAPHIDKFTIYAGQSYLIFGKSSGWSMDTSLSDSDASFIGEEVGGSLVGGHSGKAVSSAGDVNGDKYDDILIGAPFNDSGRTYLIMGKQTGWSMNTPLSNSDASFYGEHLGDDSGVSISGAGDLNGDGYDDIVIGASGNDDNGDWAGKVYIIFPDLNSNPISASTIKTFYDPEYLQETKIALFNDKIYIELTGIDGNASRQDIAVVNIVNMNESNQKIQLRLLETNVNTGIYRGHIYIKHISSERYQWIKGLPDNIINISWANNSFISTTLTICGIILFPLIDNEYAYEDDGYNMHYWAIGDADPTWYYESNATWLYWNSKTNNITGTPTNADVGFYRVLIRVINDTGYCDEHNFTLTVINKPPNIITDDLTVATEDKNYFVDYDSDDDGQGNITWRIDTNASWLSINRTNGNLTGTPTNDNVRDFYVNVSVDDGNDGQDWSNFTLTVNGVNDPPLIIGEDKIEAFEDTPYISDYEVFDEDVTDTKFLWILDTNAKWLYLNFKTGNLTGLPGNDDVGKYWVNVSVRDNAQAEDTRLFNITVLNVNDPPVFIQVPKNATIKDIDKYEFQVKAIDIDVGDTLEYNISSTPSSNISIDPGTGLIKWMPDNYGNYSVNVSVSDGTIAINHTYCIKVLWTNKRPVVTLISPADRAIVHDPIPTFYWTASDPEGDNLTYSLFFGNMPLMPSVFDPIAKNLSATNYTLTEPLEKGGHYWWWIVADDGNSGGKSETWIFEIGGNRAPEISPIPDQNVTIGDIFQFEVLATDSDPWDATNLTFDLEQLPEGMVIDPSSGIITWIPEEGQEGEYEVVVSVADNYIVVNETFIITVNPRKSISTSTDFSWILWLIIFILFLIALVLLTIGIKGIRQEN